MPCRRRWRRTSMRAWETSDRSAGPRQRPTTRGSGRTLTPRFSATRRQNRSKSRLSISSSALAPDQDVIGPSSGVSPRAVRPDVSERSPQAAARAAGASRTDRHLGQTGVSATPWTRWPEPSYNSRSARAKTSDRPPDSRRPRPKFRPLLVRADDVLAHPGFLLVASPTSTRRWRGARRPARSRPGRSATGRTLKLAAHHDAIAPEVARRPDVTLEELPAWLLAYHQLAASLGLMHKTLGPALPNAKKILWSRIGRGFAQAVCGSSFENGRRRPCGCRARSGPPRRALVAARAAAPGRADHLGHWKSTTSSAASPRRGFVALSRSRPKRGGLRGPAKCRSSRHGHRRPRAPSGRRRDRDRSPRRAAPSGRTSPAGRRRRSPSCARACSATIVRRRPGIGFAATPRRPDCPQESPSSLRQSSSLTW